ncbi:MAG: bL17 family ribosomal protein [Candidatus Peregrinibacteria bacterium]|nr:bL17 family ribosomal protein [Candidatus Peregrinibacteria bacterium]
MRHRNKKAILNRPADQRKALLRNLITSLFLTGKVKTTDAKAKALAKEAEKLISKVKGKDKMNSIRELKKVIFSKESSIKALEYIEKTEKTSGFTRATKIGYRDGDNALLVQIELL